MRRYIGRERRPTESGRKEQIVRGIVDRSTDPDLLRTELFIGGEWTSGCRDRIEVREPATEFGAVGINTGLMAT